jgi:hypothetical protein
MGMAPSPLKLKEFIDESTYSTLYIPPSYQNKMALITRPQLPSRAVAHFPLYDFLAPSFIHISRSLRSRYSTTSGNRAATSHYPHSSPLVPLSRPSKASQQATPNPAPLSKPLSKARRDFLTSAVGVPSIIFPEPKLKHV